MSGPAAELPTVPQDSRRHAGRRSLPPSASLVAAAGAPLSSLHVKPAAAYTKDVSQNDGRVAPQAIPRFAERNRAAANLRRSSLRQALHQSIVSLTGAFRRHLLETELAGHDHRGGRTLPRHR